MVKIEDVLLPDEKIVKTQEKIQLGSGAGMPVGDLYLTNKRLIFIHSKSWSLLSPSPAAGILLGKNVAIPLQDVKSVKKNFLGYLKVRSDKEYQFMVSAWKSQGWVDAVQQACSQNLQMPPPPPPDPLQGPTFATAETSTSRFCPHCGKQLKPDDNFCRNCGASTK